MAIMIDTSALIEYFLSSKKGEIVRDAIESDVEPVIIPALVLTEFVSKLSRKGINPDNFVKALAEFTVFAPLLSETAIKAGKLHAELRKVEKNIAMADCIVMQMAEEHGAKIVAADSHFKHYRNALLL